MPSLAEYQHCMQAYLLGEEDAPQALALWCTGPAEKAAARLATYRGTCTGTLVNALRLSYPALRHVLGEDYFDAVAAQFAHRAPPDRAYLNDYGAGFADFVADLPATRGLAYLRDLARLEWAVTRALHAPDIRALDPARLQALAPEALAQVALRAHPGVSVLAVQHPVERLWQLVLERDEAAMRALALHQGEGYLLIERDAQQAVQVRRLSVPFGRFTERLLAGAPLYVVLDAVAEDAAQPELLQAWLAEHLALGRVVDFSLHQSLQEEPAP